LLEAATSGEPWFFLGTDSAPHLRHRKEAPCGCAGIFTAPIALELYAEAFASINRLDQLEAFASLHGPAFYRLPPNEKQVILEPIEQEVPEQIPVVRTDSAAPDGGEEVLIPFRAGKKLGWRLHFPE
jgi:dihydroorotase